MKIKCPAKINLTLKVYPKNGDFHPIKSIMQTVSLYDFLTVEKIKGHDINFSGNSDEILYDSNNLIIKAMTAFFDTAKIKPSGLNIYIEKNIPIAAGLAGGSTNAAGMVFALEKLFPHALSKEDIFKINSKLGSDINFCYKGGRALCEGKGDDITPLPFKKFDLSIIKPKELKISTKEAYLAFDGLEDKDETFLNDLEYAMLPRHKELQTLHNLGFQMSGSGPSFFICKKNIQNIDKTKFIIFENLTSISSGVELIQPETLAMTE